MNRTGVDLSCYCMGITLFSFLYMVTASCTYRLLIYVLLIDSLLFQSRIIKTTGIQKWKVLWGVAHIPYDDFLELHEAFHDTQCTFDA